MTSAPTYSIITVDPIPSEKWLGHHTQPSIYCSVSCSDAFLLFSIFRWLFRGTMKVTMVVWGQSTTGHSKYSIYTIGIVSIFLCSFLLFFWAKDHTWGRSGSTSYRLSGDMNVTFATVVCLSDGIFFGCWFWNQMCHTWH